MRYGDTRYGVWLSEVIRNCVHTIGPGKQTVDVKTLIMMCRDEPECAVNALGVLGEQLRIQVGSRDLCEIDPNSETAVCRFLAGWIFTCYCASRGIFERRIPPELDGIIMSSPNILASVAWVEKVFSFTIADLANPK